MSADKKPSIVVSAATSADAEQAIAVVCMRVADLAPIADDDDSPLAVYERQVRERSTTERCSRCSRCDAPVIVDGTSPKNPPRVCVPCMPAMMAQANDGETLQ